MQLSAFALRTHYALSCLTRRHRRRAARAIAIAAPLLSSRGARVSVAWGRPRRPTMAAAFAREKGADAERGCRCGWHPKILTFLLTAGLGLSIMSSLDCKFLEVELGFVPENYYDESMGFGLWTYAAPGGRCLSYEESRRTGGFSDGDSVYSSLFINNDTNWSISRILGVVGIVFGSIALVSSEQNRAIITNGEHS